MIEATYELDYDGRATCKRCRMHWAQPTFRWAVDAAGRASLDLVCRACAAPPARHVAAPTQLD